MKLKPLNSFIALWNQMQWNVMTRTGKGYRMHSLKHTGKDGDRRADKIDGESKLQRKARNQELGRR